MNATIEIKTIKPEEAVFLLENPYENQRPIRPKVVSDLEREMRQGTFQLSTDAILILRGRLGNGQHRLTAVAQSGKPQQFLVLKTNDESIFKILDCGLRRSVGDAINLPNQTNVTAAARWIMALESEQATPSSGLANSKTTRSEMMGFIEKNMDQLQDASKFASQLYAKSGLLSKSVATAFICISKRKSKATEESARALLESIYTGVNCNGPANDFRNRMIANMGSKAKLTQAYIMGLLIKTFVAFISGKPGVALRFVEGEKYPDFPVQATW